MPNVTLAQAEQIIDAALERAGALGLKPLTVAVLDAGGHIVSIKRQDRSSLLRPQIAFGKAWGVLGMGLGGRELAKRAAAHPNFYTALSDVSGGRIVPVPGGVLVRDTDGEVAGAVGVSGDMPEKDEECAVCGIERAGLVADTGATP
jgi:uncharacterized protein GlcG (DUF336 family)